MPCPTVACRGRPAHSPNRRAPLNGVRQGDVAFGPETFAVRMEDASMAPALPCRHSAFVDPDEPVAPGRLVGVDDPETGAVTVQRLVEENGCRILRAADRAWPNIVLTADGGAGLLGTVAFVGRRL